MKSPNSTKSIHSPKTLLALFVGLLSTSAAAAQGQGTDFDYPELLVTPRSSERLITESAKEASNRWTSQLPIQVSSLATLVAGIEQLASPDPVRDTSGVSGIAGTVVGGTWLALTFAIEGLYHPYSTSEHELSSMPSKTPREQLMRERFSEETLQSAAHLAWRLKWLSAVTNFGANVYMASESKSGSLPQVFDGVAAALSLAPLIFGSHWQDVACEQESYKKRIYAPIASAALMREPGTGNLAPGAFMAVSF